MKEHHTEYAELGRETLRREPAAKSLADRDSLAQ
jgi:hypothetical protein